MLEIDSRKICPYYVVFLQILYQGFSSAVPEYDFLYAKTELCFLTVERCASIMLFSSRFYTKVSVLHCQCLMFFMLNLSDAPWFSGYDKSVCFLTC